MFLATSVLGIKQAMPITNGMDEMELGKHREINSFGSVLSGNALVMAFQNKTSKQYSSYAWTGGGGT